MHQVQRKVISVPRLETSLQINDTVSSIYHSGNLKNWNICSIMHEKSFRHGTSLGMDEWKIWQALSFGAMHMNGWLFEVRVRKFKLFRVL